jgi:hypothetical protein
VGTVDGLTAVEDFASVSAVNENWARTYTDVFEIDSLAGL